MANLKKTFDVFISHSASDARRATEIANQCRANGLEAATHSELLPEGNGSDALREALAESRALLALLPESGPTPTMAIEFGAAQAWNKPIFGFVTGPSRMRPPPGLGGIRLYPSGRIEDVIAAIKRTGAELSEDDRSRLAHLYAGIGVSVDELALDPVHLEELVKRFASVAGKTLPGERLLSELLRMRKQGKLPRVRPAHRSKPRKGTA